MKQSLIMTLVLLLAAAVIYPVIGAEKNGDDPSELRRLMRSSREKNDKDAEKADRRTSIAKEDGEESEELKVVDPNSAKERIKKNNELNKEVGKLDQNAEKEMHQWKKGKVEERLSLGIAVQEALIQELELVKKYASKEKAAETELLVNYLIEVRKAHFEEIVATAEIARKAELRRRQQEKKEGDRGKGRKRNTRSKTRSSSGGSNMMDRFKQ